MRPMYNIAMNAREMWGGLPQKGCTSAQDSWQVLLFEGQTCSHSRSGSLLVKLFAFPISWY